jgi:hypothetical protein
MKGRKSSRKHSAEKHERPRDFAGKGGSILMGSPADGKISSRSTKLVVFPEESICCIVSFLLDY